MNITFAPFSMPPTTALVTILAFIGLVSMLTIVSLLWRLRRQQTQAQLLVAQQQARYAAEEKLHKQQTGLQLIEAQLRESQARFSQLLEDMRQAVVLFESGRCMAANRAALAMFRLQNLDQLLNCTVLDFSPTQQPDGQRSEEKITEMMWIATELGSNVFEWQWVRANGESFVARVLLTVQVQENKQMVHAVLHDITEQKMARQDIEFLAFYDALTMLPNRILAREQLQRLLSSDLIHQTGLAVVLVRLHRLSAINEAYGEYVGDHLLLGVAMRLAKVIRPQDLLSRRAGDGFMVILEKTDSYAEISNLCDGIMACCADPFGIENMQISCAFVLGISLAPRDGHDADTLIRHANLALTQATQMGANSCYFFESQMLAASAHYAERRDTLRDAFEKEAFVLYYEPYFDLKSHEPTGVHAVPFWQYNQQLQALTEAYLETAYTSGLMVRLGRWILHQACQQARTWNESGHVICISVSLSLVQCRGARVERDVLNALSSSQLPPHQLQLKLPAHLMEIHDEACLAMFKRFSDLGIQLCLDDYGDHWINLVYFKKMGISQIAIYPCKNPEKFENDKYWQTLFHDANAFNLKSCACGVDNPRTMEKLQAWGCAQGQGPLFSPPLSGPTCETWFTQHFQTAAVPMISTSP